MSHPVPARMQCHLKLTRILLKNHHWNEKWPAQWESMGLRQRQKNCRSVNKHQVDFRSVFLLEQKFRTSVLLHPLVTGHVKCSLISEVMKFPSTHLKVKSCQCVSFSSTGNFKPWQQVFEYVHQQGLRARQGVLETMYLQASLQCNGPKVKFGPQYSKLCATLSSLGWLLCSWPKIMGRDKKLTTCPFTSWCQTVSFKRHSKPKSPKDPAQSDFTVEITKVPFDGKWNGTTH